MLPHPAHDAEPAHERPLDLILVEGFVGMTVIGIDDGELHEPQPLAIDLWAGVPHARACDTDRIGDTIHYGVVVERLRRFVAEHRTQLLEAFAEEFCGIVLREFGAAWVRMKVVKPRKFDDVAGVGVQIERRAAPRAVAPAEGGESTGRGAAVLRLIGSGMVPHTR